MQIEEDQLGSAHMIRIGNILTAFLPVSVLERVSVPIRKQPISNPFGTLGRIKERINIILIHGHRDIEGTVITGNTLQFMVAQHLAERTNPC